MVDSTQPSQRDHRPGDPLADIRRAEIDQEDTTVVENFQPLPSPQTPLTVSPQRRATSLSWIAWSFLGLLCVLLASILIVDIVNLVHRATAIRPEFGWIVGGVSVLSSLLLLWLGTTSLRTYLQVRSNLSLPQADVKSLDRDDGVEMATLRAVRERLEEQLPSLGNRLTPTDQEALSSIREDLATWPKDNTRQWILRYDENVLGVIDKVVANHIRYEATNIAILTALSPRRGLDSLFVFWRQMRLVSAVAGFYGWRPGPLGTLKLGRHVLFNATLAAGIDELSDLAVEVLPTNPIATFTGSFITEAFANAALTLRLARSCVDVCRPLRNRLSEPYKVKPYQTILEALSQVKQSTKTKQNRRGTDGPGNEICSGNP